jgi:hypothetical protein
MVGVRFTVSVGEIVGVRVTVGVSVGVDVEVRVTVGVAVQEKAVAVSALAVSAASSSGEREMGRLHAQVNRARIKMETRVRFMGICLKEWRDEWILSVFSAVKF